MNPRLGERISVCLLTYNHANVIESTLASILDQTVEGFEVIVSDDCSTDGTWESVQRMAAQDPRVKAIRTPRNVGMAGNANFAVASSTRPFIALLHHDDLYRRDLLEKWAAIMAGDPEIAFVFNPYKVHGSDQVLSESVPAGRIEGRWLLEKHLFPKWGCLVRGTAMVRRDSWERVGGMREKYGLLADVDLWMRLSMSGAVGYVSEPVITIRQQRPSYYPEIYVGSDWSWERQRYLYDIHADNRRAYRSTATVRGRLQWWLFRWRVSAETFKWLAYAALRGNRHMLATSDKSETPYDLAPLNWARSLFLRRAA